MPRLDRLERVTNLLLVLLDSPRPLSLREIADRVPGYPDSPVARRQALERDKRLLRSEGVPVLTETIGGDDQTGYRIDPDSYYLPDLGLDPREQAALNVAVAGVHLGEPIGRTALGKLGAGGEVPNRSRDAPVVDLRPVDALPALPLLFDAARLAADVTFTYRGEERHVDVAGLRFRDGHWYVVGFDRARQGPRTFRVDRIDDLPVVGEPGGSLLPGDFDVEGAFAREPWQFGGGSPVDVEVAVDAVEAGRVVDELGEETVVSRDDDGGVVVRLRVTDRDALVRWVLDLLDHAVVVAPPDVRSAVVAHLEAVAARGVGPMTVVLDTGKRLRRLLAILAWLAQVGEASVDDVADRFDLSPSALVAELEMAACCGVPPYTPDQLLEILVTDTTVAARVGTSLARPRRLSPAEGFSLAASARALLAVPGSDADGALSRALSKLEAALGPGAGDVEVDLDAPAFLSEVQEALASGRGLAVTYYSASSDRTTERTLAPLRLFAADGHWYVDAYCALAGDVRRFRVDRIGAAELVDRPGPSGTAAHLAEGTDAFVPGPESRTVQLSVAPSAAWMVESVPTTTPVAAVGRRVVVQIEVGGEAWLERLLLQLGTDARVVRPAAYRDLAAEAASRVLRRYREESSGV